MSGSRLSLVLGHQDSAMFHTKKDSHRDCVCHHVWGTAVLKQTFRIVSHTAVYRMSSGSCWGFPLLSPLPALMVASFPFTMSMLWYNNGKILISKVYDGGDRPVLSFLPSQKDFNVLSFGLFLPCSISLNTLASYKDKGKDSKLFHYGLLNPAPREYYFFWNFDHLLDSLNKYYPTEADTLVAIIRIRGDWRGHLDIQVISKAVFRNWGRRRGTTEHVVS